MGFGSLRLDRTRRQRTHRRIQREHAARHPAYTITALAKEFALTTRAIRFYEDEGLLAPQRVGRVRIYSERERIRLKLILRGKRLGLTLSEIRELLDMYEVARDERGAARQVPRGARRPARAAAAAADDIDASWRRSTARARVPAPVEGAARRRRRPLPARRAGRSGGSEPELTFT